jgi:hypothetical protein
MSRSTSLRRVKKTSDCVSLHTHHIMAPGPRWMGGDLPVLQDFDALEDQFFKRPVFVANLLMIVP